jgi:hypothetical protein
MSNSIINSFRFRIPCLLPAAVKEYEESVQHAIVVKKQEEEDQPRQEKEITREKKRKRRSTKPRFRPVTELGLLVIKDEEEEEDDAEAESNSEATTQTQKKNNNHMTALEEKKKKKRSRRVVNEEQAPLAYFERIRQETAPAIDDDLRRPTTLGNVILKFEVPRIPHGFQPNTELIIPEDDEELELWFEAIMEPFSFEEATTTTSMKPLSSGEASGEATATPEYCADRSGIIRGSFGQTYAVRAEMHKRDMEELLRTGFYI